MDADRHVHPRPAARSTPQRLKIESTGRTPLLAAWRHHTPDRPPPCRRCRHRGDDPVKVATNATIFVFIESDSVIVIFSAGQHPLPAPPPRRMRTLSAAHHKTHPSAIRTGELRENEVTE